MITISNVTHPEDLDKPIHLYVVEINGSVIFHFRHKPSNGLVGLFNVAAMEAHAFAMLEATTRLPK